MAGQTQSRSLSRDALLKALHPHEAARVGCAETDEALPYGDEYLDLHELDLGVQRAVEVREGRGTRLLLPRRAIEASTWTKILSQAAAARMDR